MTKYRFPDCNCEFEVIGKHADGTPKLQFNPEQALSHLNCERTWRFICEGNTKGIFQLESRLGQHWAKKLKPNSIEHLSALIALLRPGCLEALMEDGKNLTTHYCMRKNGEEPVSYFHPVLEPILKDTYGILCIEENTYINTNMGLKKIKDIKPNDKINSVNLTNNTIDIDECLDVKPTKKCYGYTIRLKNGYKITLTDDHKVYTDEGWIEVKDLNKQKHLVAVPKYAINDKIEDIDSVFSDKSTQTAYFIGQLLGDGHIGANIASGTLENHKKLFCWLKDNIKLNFSERFHVRSWYIDIHNKILIRNKKYGNRKTTYRVWVENLGLHKTNNDKNIPTIIFNTNAENRRAFLAGMLDSDGYVSSPKSLIHYCSGNIETIYGIRYLLSLDGIESYIDPDEVHIYIQDIDKFIDLIGPHVVLKKEELCLFKKTIRHSYGSIKSELIKDRISKHYKQSIKSFCRENNISADNILKNKNLFHGRWLGELVGISNKNINFIEIKTIIPTKDIKQFYSISVKNNHNLIGNGILIKNCFQEQSMRIAKDIAGFSDTESDSLRKALGKKLPELVAKVKIKFLEGCKQKNIVTEDEAKQIFEWIEKGQRYVFNASHSVSYALNSYVSAYAKAHFKRAFFTSWLRYAKEKIKPHEEVAALISNAKLMNIDICTPNLCIRNDHFKLQEGKIYFGLSDIKGIGNSAIERLINRTHEVERILNKNICDITWLECLLYLSPYITSTTTNSLICGGALDYIKQPRTKMLYEYSKYELLSAREKSLIEQYYLLAETKPSNLIETLTIMSAAQSGRGQFCSNKKRSQLVSDIILQLKNPPYSLQDSPGWIAREEKYLLGFSITFSEVDECDVSSANTTCKEFIQKTNLSNVACIAVVVDIVNELKTKNGKNPGKLMAFMTVSDSSAQLADIVIFPEEYKEFKKLLIPGNKVVLMGERGQKNNSDTFIVKKVTQLA